MNQVLTELWATRIWIGRVSEPGLRECSLGARAGEARDASGGPLTWEPSKWPEFVGDLETAGEKLASVGRSAELRWVHRIETWLPGAHSPLRYGNGLVRGIVVLSSDIPSEHPQSGGIELQDPRAGSGNVGVPGLPWGRSAKIPAIAGVAAVFPGWLAWSIAPLRAPHALVLWVAEAFPASCEE